MADVAHTTRHARDFSLESRIELNQKEAPSEPHNWRPPTERAVFQLPQCHRDGFNDYKEPAPIYLYPLGGYSSPSLSLSEQASKECKDAGQQKAPVLAHLETIIGVEW